MSFVDAVGQACVLRVTRTLVLGIPRAVRRNLADRGIKKIVPGGKNQVY